MPILAIDTSDRSAEVALYYQSRLIKKRSVDAKSVEHLPQLLRVCFEAFGVSLEQVEVLLVSLGPGSFTGIRAGLAFAQGLHAAKPRTFIGISSLLAKAHLALLEEQSDVVLQEHPQTSQLVPNQVVTLEATKSEYFFAEFAHSASKTLPLTEVQSIEKSLLEQRTEVLSVDELSGAEALIRYYLDCLSPLEEVDFSAQHSQVKDLSQASNNTALYVKSLNAKTLVERGLPQPKPLD